MNMQKLLKQAKEMEKKMRQELDETIVETTVGGGMVRTNPNSAVKRAIASRSGTA